MAAEQLGGALVLSLCCIVAFGIPAALPVYGLVMGFRRRRQTRDLLADREPRVAHLLRTSTQPRDHPGPTALVHGNVAYAADAPARWAMSWRNIAGGHAASLDEQVDMARRLATLRVLEQAAAQGAVAVTNIRLETSQLDMSSQQGQGTSMIIEIMACATALLPPDRAHRP